MSRAALALLVLLAGCGTSPAPAPEQSGAGAQLERAAIAAGMVGDPTHVDPVGVFASESDHVCILRAGGGYRIGASVDYGDGHHCIARGTAKGVGTLAVTLGAGCRFEARLDGAKLAFPPVLPQSCEQLCTGRASLSALTAERLSAAESEAASLPAPDGKPLCGAAG
ncbi:MULTISPECIES: hypothetical protein [unclassified Sphingomonas]|uniref:hypothetical protein n=1 Tax=unclassified Sphingomonas TaxID=196159 RepID=UPI00092CD7CB|nr:MULTISPECIES: hypothetical protein [unclassified Sphingomonas]OJU14746.1 MAG: hypothetical protein BGN95_11765 [Sphingomonas sp. 66-10]